LQGNYKKVVRIDLPIEKKGDIIGKDYEKGTWI